jgi:hypothetical protein
MPSTFQTSLGPPSGHCRSNPTSVDFPSRLGPSQPGQPAFAVAAESCLLTWARSTQPTRFLPSMVADPPSQGPWMLNTRNSVPLGRSATTFTPDFSSAASINTTVSPAWISAWPASAGWARVSVGTTKSDAVVTASIILENTTILLAGCDCQETGTTWLAPAATPAVQRRKSFVDDNFPSPQPPPGGRGARLTRSSPSDTAVGSDGCRPRSW